MAEVSPLNEHQLARKLCGEHLSAVDLKEVCNARGFPVIAGPKKDVADSVAARLLDPLGVSEAMASLGNPWLAALHLVASKVSPSPIDDLAFALRDPADLEATEKHRYRSLDYRKLCGAATSGLLRKGVILVTEDEPLNHREKSRYARFRFLLPEAFKRLLPPFPLPTEAMDSASVHGNAQRLLREALVAFVVRDGKTTKASKKVALAQRLADQIGLEDGALTLSDMKLPSLEKLLRVVEDCWAAQLDAEVGPVARHIVAHLPSGQGCSPSQLVRALRRLGLAATDSDLASFCEEGSSAGLLARGPGHHGEPIFRAQSPGTAGDEGEGTLTVTPMENGVAVDLRESDPLAVLQAATFSRSSVRGGHLVLEPDPIRLGRAFEELGGSASLCALRAVSPAFDAAARRVETRRGQVIVHRNVVVMRLSDVGLRALMEARLPGKVRGLSGEWLAVTAGGLDEALALAKKEGFVARRVAAP